LTHFFPLEKDAVMNHRREKIIVGCTKNDKNQKKKNPGETDLET
jgi:hypothetical protein